ncbi:MAG: hypothetical protein K2X38_08465 [Gemmataceae bacterium]|nr:hypothetical protein [Gemmataceae bacterium]
MHYRIRLAAMSIFALAAFGVAQGDANLRRDVDAIAKAVKEKKNDQAKKLAAAFAKANAIDEMMHLYKPGKKGGLGIGPADAPIAPNGIASAVQGVAKGALPPATVLAKPLEFEEMAWRIAALGDATAAYAPQTDRGKKTRQLWLQIAADSREAALDFRAAILARNAKGLVNAATRISDACNACHATFR